MEFLPGVMIIFRDGYAGESRGDLQAVFTLAHKMGKTELFSDMLSKPEDIEDGLLIALIKSTAEDEDGVGPENR